ncbi:response regulator [Patescibacteria group bacterium]|nr:response regulator [Patescibacteria group bacterium]
MATKKIYIVEDDADLLYDLESQFAADGFEVETSYGDEEPEELVNNIEQFETDYIILDLILPKVDGFDLIKRLKVSDILSAKPVFVFTDLSDEDSKTRSMDLGADYIFFKNDFDAFDFSEKVKKIIANKDKGVDGDDITDDESNDLEFTEE